MGYPIWISHLLFHKVGNGNAVKIFICELIELAPHCNGAAIIDSLQSTCGVCAALARVSPSS